MSDLRNDTLGSTSISEIKEAVRQLARDRKAVILAHNYQVPDVQDIAHHVGDSLELSRLAAETDAEVIVFCGVHFMAETAKILSPHKRVLIPSLDAGCSLAESITAEQVRDWKAEHPSAVVVMYVNTSAEVKAEADYCCTSSNAAKVVASIAPDTGILFGPDMFLAEHVERTTGRRLTKWMGECHVHAGIQPSDIQTLTARHPSAEIHIHPECGCASHALYLASVGDLPADRTLILSTGEMTRRAKELESGEAIVATEIGMLHRLGRENPDVNFIAANPEASCRYMKMVTLANVLGSLQRDRFEVTIPHDVAERARIPLERMLAIS